MKKMMEDKEAFDAYDQVVRMAEAGVPISQIQEETKFSKTTILYILRAAEAAAAGDSEYIQTTNHAGRNGRIKRWAETKLVRKDEAYATSSAAAPASHILNVPDHPLSMKTVLLAASYAIMLKAEGAYHSFRRKAERAAVELVCSSYMDNRKRRASDDPRQESQA